MADWQTDALAHAYLLHLLFSPNALRSPSWSWRLDTSVVPRPWCSTLVLRPRAACRPRYRTKLSPRLGQVQASLSLCWLDNAAPQYHATISGPCYCRQAPCAQTFLPTLASPLWDHWTVLTTNDGPAVVEYANMQLW